MRGIVLPGDKEAHVKQWDDTEVGPTEVRVDIGAAALCRSDMSLYYGDPLVGSKPAGEVVPGHEPAGTIAETGAAVDHLAPGDRVAIDCFAGCGHCTYCRRGEPNLCPDVEILGFDRHGGDAERLVTPASTCHPIPDEMSMATAAVSTDALGNLYSAVKGAGVDATDVVGVVGLGPMGLSGVLAADGFGAEVVAFDLVDHRREKALDLGAHHALDPKTDDVPEAVASITDGRGLDVVLECSGAPAGIEMALEQVGKKGSVVQVGEAEEVTVRPSDHLVHKTASYDGHWYFAMWEWPEIAEFIVDTIGNDRAEGIISDEYPLEDEAVGEAFRRFDNRETQKVIFTP